DDDILLTGERPEGCQIRIVSRLADQSSFALFKRCQASFQFLKHWHGVQHTPAAEPKAVLVEGLPSGFDDLLVLGKPQVIIGSEIDIGLALDSDAWTLRTGQNPRLMIASLLLQGCQLLSQALLQVIKTHLYNPLSLPGRATASQSSAF